VYRSLCGLAVFVVLSFGSSQFFFFLCLFSGRDWNVGMGGCKDYGSSEKYVHGSSSLFAGGDCFECIYQQHSCCVDFHSRVAILGRSLQSLSQSIANAA
jgi:hypothetical protein